MNRPAELLTGITGSILAFLVAFGINLSDDQAASVLAVVAWVPAIVTWYVSRTGSKNQAQNPQR